MPEFMVIDGVLRATVHPLDQFVSGKFYKVTVSADITATMGVRKPAAGAKKASGAKKVAGAKRPAAKPAAKKRPATKKKPSTGLRRP
jgi:hypothetical protein